MARRRLRRRRSNPRNEGPFLFLMLLLLIGGLFGATVAPLNNFLDKYGPATTKTTVVFALAGCLVALVTPFIVRYLRKKKREEKYRLIQTTGAFLGFEPYEFEKYIAWVFEKRGYQAQVTRASGDHGIDVILTKDGKRYMAQAKRYKPDLKISEGELRDFYGSFVGNAEGGFFVTTSDFTLAAREWAKDKPITLINSDDLSRIVSGFQTG